MTVVRVIDGCGLLLLMLYFSVAEYVLWFIVYLLLGVTESIVLLSFSRHALLGYLLA
jgi:hypothetical protein